MKCEICGTEATTKLRRHWLCEEHFQMADQNIDVYIESLKPKVTVQSVTGGGYQLEAVRQLGYAAGNGDTLLCNIIHLYKEAADALYNYMRREREG